jgi:L-threonylcarbamoyladenylate synthase
MTKNLIQTLLKNDVSIIPTDTLYGLVGRALSKKAVEKIYKLKGRKPTKPLIILISSLKDLELLKIDWKSKNTFLKKVWPGAMSVILPCTNKKFEYLHRGTKSLAFRMPDDKKLLALIRKNWSTCSAVCKSRRS